MDIDNEKDKLILQIDDLRLGAIVSLEELRDLIKQNDTICREIFNDLDVSYDDINEALKIIERI